MEELSSQYALTTEYAQRIISEIESSSNQNRKKDCYKSYEIKEGLLFKYVQERLAEMFPKSYMHYSLSDYSILKKIVNKKAKAYKEAPIRSLEDNNDTDEYQKITKENCLNSAMKEIDGLFNEHKYCALAVFPRIENNKETPTDSKIEFDFIPMAPYLYDLIKDQKGETQVVVLSYPDKAITSGSGTNDMISQSSSANEGDVRSYVFWTKNEHRVFKAKGKGKDLTIWEEVIVGNDNGINPFGMIPIIDIPKTFEPNYPIPSPMARQTIELNALLSVYLQSGSMQVGQLVLKYPSDQPIETVTSGIFTGIKLPQSKEADDAETTADYISPSPDLAGHKDSIMTFMNMILDEQGIQGNQVVNPNETFSSGVDRLLASADVQEIIEENQNKYLDVEHEIFEMVKKMTDILGGYKFKSDSLNVRFQKPKMMISDSEKLENLKRKKELGIFEDWELLIDYNPNLSEQEAKERIELMIKTENEKRKNSLSVVINANK